MTFRATRAATVADVKAACVKLLGAGGASRVAVSGEAHGKKALTSARRCDAERTCRDTLYSDAASPGVT